MGVNTQRYIRKPLYVEAVRVTAQNFDEIVAWCQGEIQTDEVPGNGTTKKFIKVRVHNPKNPRQTKAFIGDWILYTERGYKVYTNKAFRAAFDLVQQKAPEPERTATAEEIRQALPHAEDRRPQAQEPVIDESSAGVEEVAESPTAPPQDDEKTHPVQSVEPGADLGSTPQGEPIEVVEATPQAIADAVNEQQPPEEEAPVEEEPSDPDPVEEFEATAVPDAPPTAPAIVPPEVAPQPEVVSEQPPQDPAEGKTVLSVAEQEELGPENVRELVQEGNVILEQDLAESA